MLLHVGVIEPTHSTFTTVAPFYFLPLLLLAEGGDAAGKAAAASTGIAGVHQQMHGMEPSDSFTFTTR